MDWKVFERKAREVHGDSYTYVEVEDIKYGDKVKATCNLHGNSEFQTVGNHLKGKHPCKQCGVEARRASRKMKEEDFYGLLEGKYLAHYEDYKNNSTPLSASCAVHGGDFTITVAGVTRGTNFCTACFEEANGYKREKTFEDFLASAREVHGDKYDYVEDSFKHYSCDMDMYCKEHYREFSQLPRNHLKGYVGCTLCAREKSVASQTKPFEDVIKDFRDTHGDKFEYFKDTYQGCETRMKMFCGEHREEFWQSPYVHINAVYGCPSCWRDAVTKPNEEKEKKDPFREAEERHGDKFTYYKETYINKRTPTKIRCNDHDFVFWQSLSSHIKAKHSCPKCNAEGISIRCKDSKEDVIVKAREAHGDKYDYSRMIYKGSQVAVEIFCAEHNILFWQNPDTHLRGSVGCSKCHGAGTSSMEQDFIKFIESVCEHPLLENDRSTLGNRYELDVVIPELKIAFEFNGTYWHSDKMRHKNYHKEKWEMAKAVGYELFFIWEEEWTGESREAVENFIRNKVGFFKDSKPIRASKTEIVIPERKAKTEFYNKHHIQGETSGSSIHLALQYEGEYVCMVSFKPCKGGYDLTRFASSRRIHGGFSKLLKHFIVAYQPDMIKTFSDIQHFSGNMYEKCGFVLDKVLPPNYQVFHRMTGTLDKQNWRRAKIPNMLKRLGKEELNFNPDPLVDPRTEFEMQDLCGALRLWDCGKIRWVYYK